MQEQHHLPRATKTHHGAQRVADLTCGHARQEAAVRGLSNGPICQHKTAGSLQPTQPQDHRQCSVRATLTGGQVSQRGARDLRASQSQLNACERAPAAPVMRTFNAFLGRSLDTACAASVTTAPATRPAASATPGVALLFTMMYCLRVQLCAAVGTEDAVCSMEDEVLAVLPVCVTPRAVVWPRQIRPQVSSPSALGREQRILRMQCPNPASHAFPMSGGHAV
jgi:hypothetical protein